MSRLNVPGKLLVRRFPSRTGFIPAALVVSVLGLFVPEIVQLLPRDSYPLVHMQIVHGADTFARLSLHLIIGVLGFHAIRFVFRIIRHIHNITKP